MSLWKDAWKLRKHESTCTGGVRRVYPGGVYHSTPSAFERLDDENIRVSESLRYYPYRATFDFECWFDTEQLPSDSDQVHWVARHVPLSVSVASNVPGHEQVKCLFTDGDTNKLVSTMMDILRSMSDAAYDNIKDSYEDVLEQLAEALTNWDEREEAARSATDKESRQATNPYKKLMGQLYGWMHQFAVDSPIDRGSETRRAVRRAERSTRGHRVCSRSSGPMTGSWDCVARRTIVSEPPTSTAPKD